jgi:hypothetical protein
MVLPNLASSNSKDRGSAIKRSKILDMSQFYFISRPFKRLFSPNLCL